MFELPEASRVESIGEVGILVIKDIDMLVAGGAGGAGGVVIAYCTLRVLCQSDQYCK